MTPAPLPLPLLQVCRTCGIEQPLASFAFRKAEQTYRRICKACRAAWLRAYRRDPAHVERLRQAERARSASRRPAIRAWERAHPDNLRPGRQRRAARAKARRAEAHLAALTPVVPAPAAGGPALEQPSLPEVGVGG